MQLRSNEPAGGRYGAPMGRPVTGRQFEVLPDAPPFHLVRVRLDSGGYDRGGAYWGHGEPLYEFTGPVTDISGFVRGSTRELAKAAVRRIHPAARFFR